MSNFAIIGISKLKGAAIGSSDAHADRTRDTPNANEELLDENKYLRGGKTPLRELLNENFKEFGGKQRKDAVECLEFMCTASPEFFSSEPGKEEEKLEQFIERIEVLMDVLEKNGIKIIKAVVHLDETTPHASLFGPPRDKKGVLNAKYHVGTRAKMAGFHDLYADVMKPLRLKRGVRRSHATHHDVKQFYNTIISEPELQITSQHVPNPPEIINNEEQQAAYKEQVVAAIRAEVLPQVTQMRNQAMLTNHYKGFREAAEARAAKLADQLKLKENEIENKDIELAETKTKLKEYEAKHIEFSDTKKQLSALQIEQTDLSFIKVAQILTDQAGNASDSGETYFADAKGQLNFYIEIEKNAARTVTGEKYAETSIDLARQILKQDGKICTIPQVVIRLANHFSDEEITAALGVHAYQKATVDLRQLAVEIIEPEPVGSSIEPFAADDEIKIEAKSSSAEPLTSEIILPTNEDNQLRTVLHQSQLEETEGYRNSETSSQQKIAREENQPTAEPTVQLTGEETTTPEILPAPAVSSNATQKAQIDLPEAAEELSAAEVIGMTDHPRAPGKTFSFTGTEKFEVGNLPKEVLPTDEEFEDFFEVLDRTLPTDEVAGTVADAKNEKRDEAPAAEEITEKSAKKFEEVTKPTETATKQLSTDAAAELKSAAQMRHSVATVSPEEQVIRRVIKDSVVDKTVSVDPAQPSLFDSVEHATVENKSNKAEIGPFDGQPANRFPEEPTLPEAHKKFLFRGGNQQIPAENDSLNNIAFLQTEADATFVKAQRGSESEKELLPVEKTITPKTSEGKLETEKPPLEAAEINSQKTESSEAVKQTLGQAVTNVQREAAETKNEVLQPNAGRAKISNQTAPQNLEVPVLPEGILTGETNGESVSDVQTSEKTGKLEPTSVRELLNSKSANRKVDSDPAYSDIAVRTSPIEKTANEKANTELQKDAILSATDLTETARSKTEQPIEKEAVSDQAITPDNENKFVQTSESEQRLTALNDDTQKTDQALPANAIRNRQRFVKTDSQAEEVSDAVTKPSGVEITADDLEDRLKVQAQNAPQAETAANDEQGRGKKPEAEKEIKIESNDVVDSTKPETIENQQISNASAPSALKAKNQPATELPPAQIRESETSVISPTSATENELSSRTSNNDYSRNYSSNEWFYQEQARIFAENQAEQNQHFQEQIQQSNARLQTQQIDYQTAIESIAQKFAQVEEFGRRSQEEVNAPRHEELDISHDDAFENLRKATAFDNFEETQTQPILSDEEIHSKLGMVSEMGLPDDTDDELSAQRQSQQTEDSKKREREEQTAEEKKSRTVDFDDDDFVLTKGRSMKM
jgi:hypothetical protein